MKVQPVSRYRSDRYPIHTVALQDPTLLKTIPRRWRSKQAVLIALGATGLIASTVWAQERPALGGKIVPPWFLTERDAITIAKAEAKRVGVHLVLKGQHIPLTIRSKDGKHNRKVSYLLDEIDPKTGVGFEFVSTTDCEKVYGHNTNVKPSELAKTIRKSLVAAKKGGRVKVLAENRDGEYEAQQKKLRKELRSFLKWLKAQGVI